MSDAYRAFLEAKVPLAAREGHAVVAGDVHPMLKPHQVAIVQWAVAGGRLAAELNHGYFRDGAAYCAAAEREADVPTLFDL